jgi:hypothetical protein
MFVLASLACQGFGFVTVFKQAHKAIIKTHAKPLRITLLSIVIA